MRETGQAPREPRWPVALAIVGVYLLLVVLPERIRLLPSWALWASAAVVLAPMGVAALATAKALWLRVETAIVLAFVAFAGLANVTCLSELLRDIIGRSTAVSGLTLLSSSVALWCVNVLMFSLLYWQMDRGGPGARSAAIDTLRDWSFPQDCAPPGEVRPGWRPTYPDYLFLSFSTATAFSTTEVAPFTTRAKMAMMTEALISLMTLALVAARAINILGA
ncbi:MAG: hypothetical protein JO127_08095 [Caulobacteraceae bacterium]|nr:hypothetical protein [Caulobacteraceae bacterium]